MNRTVVQFSNYSWPLEEFSTLNWEGGRWEGMLEQIILLTFRKLTHSVPMSVFVHEKAGRREEKQWRHQKASGTVVKAGHLEYSSSSLARLGKGILIIHRTTQSFKLKFCTFCFCSDCALSDTHILSDQGKIQSQLVLALSQDNVK